MLKSRARKFARKRDGRKGVLRLMWRNEWPEELGTIKAGQKKALRGLSMDEISLR